GPGVAGVFATGTGVDGDDQVPDGERLAAAPTRFVVTFGENVLGANVAANYRLLDNNFDVSSQISSVAFAFNATSRKHEATLTLAGPLAAGDYRLVILSGAGLVRDSASNPLDGAADGDGLGEDFERRFTVAPPVRKGPEFRVNGATADNQRNASVAVDADGDSVVVWESVNQDGSGYGVFAQRFNAAGLAQGGEFKVNTFVNRNQRNASVAMDADGDFVVAWESDVNDLSGYGVFAQRYDAAGAPQGGEFLVNNFTTGDQTKPSVAMDADGDFVVVWQSLQDGGGYGVYAKRYAADGLPQGTEFPVNTFTTGDQAQPNVAMDADGDFVVAWQSNRQDGFLYGFYGVYAQRYDAAGSPQGGEFLVNTFTTGAQTQPSAAMDADGDFVVAWQSSSNQDGDRNGVFAQRYNAAGMPQGSEFRVNSFTPGEQAAASVAMDADGDFVVAWTSYGQEGSNYGVYARRYDAVGAVQGNEFRVNTFTTNNQGNPSVALNADGDFVVTWTSFGQDGDRDGVFAQRFAVNRPTLADPGARAVNEGTALSFILNGADADGDSLLYTITAGALPGMTFDLASGAFFWTPAENQDGPAVVTFRVSDGVFAAERTITITVGEVNAAPVLGAIGSKSVNELAALTFAATATDADRIAGAAQTLTFSLGGTVPAGASITPAGVFTWTPTEAQGPGVFTFTVMVSDGALTTAEEITITVAEVADPPVVTPPVVIPPPGTTPPPGATANRAPVLATRPIRPITSGASGFTAASLLRGRVTDPDVGARQGIAITRLTGTGRWLFQRGGRGAWRTIPRPTTTRPFLLAAESRLRFVPTGSNRAGTLRFRAWDQTTGRPNALFQLPAGAIGGSGTFSIAQATARVTGTATPTATARSAKPTLTAALLDALWTEAAVE
ncbi:MAG: putative Ig domain-containing protein, partial [Planctomycetia bacterium]